MRGHDRLSVQAQSCGSSDAPKKNVFYALNSMGEQEISPNVMRCMLKVFSIYAFALFDLGATLLSVTPLVATKFEILPNNLHEPFIVSTPVGALVVAKRVYKNCPIMLHN